MKVKWGTWDRLLKELTAIIWKLTCIPVDATCERGEFCSSILFPGGTLWDRIVPRIGGNFARQQRRSLTQKRLMALVAQINKALD